MAVQAQGNPAERRRGAVLIGPRPSTSTWVLWILLVASVALTLAFAVAPFVTSRVEVEPAQVPAGRVVWTSVHDGQSRTYVQCPGALRASQGTDLLCRAPARSQLIAQLTGLVLFAAADVVLVVLIRSRRRRRAVLRA